MNHVIVRNAPEERGEISSFGRERSGVFDALQSPERPRQPRVDRQEIGVDAGLFAQSRE